MARFSSVSALAGCVFIAVLSACDNPSAPIAEKQVLTTDPVISRALNDPLMIDPDLAWINEANAAIGYHGNHALPAFAPDPVAARRARDAARIELREGGGIEELPVADSLPDGASLKGLSTLGEILEAAGAPPNCAQGASDDLAWAAKMPDAAAIIPHGMVQQAAGSNGSECSVRVVRYLSQADLQDVLQYHYSKGVSAKLEMSYMSGETELIKGERAGEKMAVELAQAPSGLRLVTLVHWRY